MKRVRRFSVPPTGLFQLAMPIGSTLLTAQPQGADNVVLWALIDDAKPAMVRSFLLTMTDTPIETTHDLEHVATVQTTTDPIAEFHLFEVKGPIIARAPHGLRATQ